MKDQYKIHETPEDRARQEEIIKTVCDAKEMQYEMEPKLTAFDAKLWQADELIALAEVKYRNNPFDQYPDYTIDSAKINALIEDAWMWGTTPVLIVSWQGDIRYVFPKNKTYRQSVQKRKDRDELPDPVYHIPLDDFRSL